MTVSSIYDGLKIIIENINEGLKLIIQNINDAMKRNIILVKKITEIF